MPPKRKSATARTRARAPAPPPRRQSTRRRVPPTKSPYFEHPSEDEGDAHSEGSNDNTSDFADEKATPEDDDEDSVASEEQEKEDEEEEDEEEERVSPPPKKRRAAPQQPRTFAKQRKVQVQAGEIFIPNRAPSPGSIDYADDQIHPNTLMFLEDLALNNNRTWLHEHDGHYRIAKADFEKLVDCITTAMPERVDDTIPELPVKDLVFRIHRDIRFSNDQTPYKTHFSAAWSRTGRKGPYACYYLQIKPGQSLAGGGLWHPEAQALGLIRRSIDRHPERLKAVLTGEKFATEFFENPPKLDEESIVKLFAAKNAEDALKTAPKNYPRDHKDIDLLRLKSFTIGKALTDKEVVSPDLVDRVTMIFRRMEPLITYLNSCVMPDDGSSSSEDED